MNDATQAQNSVQIQPAGYIEITITGSQSYNTYDEIRPEVEKCIDQLQSEGKPVCGLVNLSQMTSFDMGANQAAFELLDHLPYDRLALYGANDMISAVANTLIQATGKSEKAHLFKERTAALDWLLADDLVASE